MGGPVSYLLGDSPATARWAISGDGSWYFSRCAGGRCAWAARALPGRHCLPGADIAPAVARV